MTTIMKDVMIIEQDASQQFDITNRTYDMYTFLENLESLSSFSRCCCNCAS